MSDALPRTILQCDLIPGDCAKLPGGCRVWCVAPTRGLYWNNTGPSMLCISSNTECTLIDSHQTLSGGMKFIKGNPSNEGT